MRERERVSEVGGKRGVLEKEGTVRVTVSCLLIFTESNHPL